MTGIDVGEDAPGGVVLGEEGSGETQSALAVGASVLVHIRHQFRQGDLSGGERFQARLKRGHEHGGGNALAGDVGHREHYAVLFGRFPRAREHIIVVPCHGVGRTSGVGNRDAGNLRRSAGQQPGLNLAGNLEIAFHDDAVGNLQHEQQEKQQTAPEMEVEFDDVKIVPRIVIAESAAGEQQHDERHQQQHSAGG